MTPVEQLYKTVSLKTGIPVPKLREIFTLQFKLVTEEMGKFQGTKMRLPYIGIFEDNEARRNSIINKRKQQQKNEQQD